MRLNRILLAAVLLLTLTGCGSKADRARASFDRLRNEANEQMVNAARRSGKDPDNAR